MLSSLTTNAPSQITAVSNTVRRSVTFREPKEVAKAVDCKDDRCSTSVDEDESDICDIGENVDYYYQKEKWNPNNYYNPLKKNDYFDDDVSLQLDDIFPEDSDQCQHNIDLMHGTRNLNCFMDDDDEITLSESFSSNSLSQEEFAAPRIEDEQRTILEHKKTKPMHELSFTTVENTSFQTLSESQTFFC